MAPSPRILRHPGLNPLWQSMEREHRYQQLTAVVLVLGGLATCLFTLRYAPVYPFLGALAASLGVYWLYRLLSTQPAAAWREALREHPERIVWVYSLVTERVPFGLNLMRSGTLYLVDDRGEAFSFSLPAEQLLLVTKTLNRLLPHAEFGYTEAREERYLGTVTRYSQRYGKFLE